jgi:5-methylcytosine-specific restriction enzyme subunit McrC
LPEPGSGLENRALGGSKERSQAADLAKAGMLEVSELRTGLSIKSFSHVGRIRIGSLTVTIVPKLNRHSLLNLLRYAFGFRKLNLRSDADQRLDHAEFADLLVHQLIEEVDELLSRGLYRTYVPSSEWLSVPRGRIDLRRLASQGGVVTAHLPCTHHPREEDTPVNRALHAGLVLAGSLTADLGLRRKAHRLAALFGELVTTCPLNTNSLGQIIAALNRLTAHYRPALSIVRLLFESQGVVLEHGESGVKLPGFLFDMNRFFQALVSRFLLDHLTGYSVREEQKLHGVLQYVAGYNPQGCQPLVPRPDFMVFQGTRLMAVLDAKYRDLWKRELPREMLYQLALYAVAQPTKVATILYPTIDTAASEARLAIRSPASGERIARVNLRPIVLPALEKMLMEGTNSAAVRKREQYALQLLFGK